MLPAVTVLLLLQASPSLADANFENIAHRVSHSIDNSVSACDDFYQYACGTWIKEAQLSYGRSSKNAVFDTANDVVKDMIEIYTDKTDSGSIIIENMKLAYNKCMSVEDEDPVGHLLSKVNKLGGWPMLDNCTTPKERSFSTGELTELLIKMRNVAFVQLSVRINESNTSGDHGYQLEIGRIWGLHTIGKHVYKNPEKFQIQERSIKNYMFEKISLLKTDYEKKKHSASISGVTMREVDEIFELEKKIFDAESSYEIATVVTLEHVFERVDWRTLIQATVGKELNFRQQRFNVDVGYLTALDKIFATTEKRILLNYIFWQYMRIVYLTKYQLDERYMKTDMVYTAISKSIIANQPREMACAMTLNWFSEMPIHATSAMYARKHVGAAVVHEFNITREYIERAIIDILNIDASWMEHETKQTAIDKIKNMTLNIGSPEWVMNNTLLDDYYRELEISEHDSYSTILEKISDFTHKEEMQKLDRKVDRKEFKYPASFVNGAHDAPLNAMQLPAGMFRFPFFGTTFPKFVNYGMLGFTVAHEYTHAFDMTGKEYNEVGNRVNWWDANSTIEFNKRTKCMKDQFSQYHIDGTEYKVKGDFTLSENIADAGGLKAAYRAYKYWQEDAKKKHMKDLMFEKEESLSLLNEDQLFFVSFAQSYCAKKTKYDKIERYNWDNHTPDKYRVIGTLSNMPEFAEAFHCPAGSRMAPKKRCAVW